MSSGPPASGFIHLSLVISLISNKIFFWIKFQWFHLWDLKNNREGVEILGPGILSLDPLRKTPGLKLRKQRFATRAGFTPGDVWQCRLFLTVPTGGCYWHLVAKGRGYHPPVHRSAPTTTHQPGLNVQNVNVQVQKHRCQGSFGWRSREPSS